MVKLEVFDPAMCCTTGICGHSDDPKLVIFASDLEWLKEQGAEVLRHGLSFEPTEFVKNEVVKTTLQDCGNVCLPIILVDNEMVSKGSYPSRERLAELCKVEFNEQEAPPIHREENCCCGVDCDCNSVDRLGENSYCNPESACIPPEIDESGCGAECDCS